MDDKTKSIVAHLTFIGWIIALVTNQSDKGPNTSFYLRQNLGLWLIAIAGSVLGMLTINIIGTIISIAIFVLWVLSLVGALGGEQKPSPVLGDMFQQWFKGLS
ncbi:MAG TPA: hypothetical protein VLA46_00220 [Saprospiraceae bacterium]|nr:hypothetical protein [Saprospiraceae bacterium]